MNVIMASCALAYKDLKVLNAKYCLYCSASIFYNKICLEENRTPQYAEMKVIFTFVLPCILTNFFIIKPTRCTNLTNLFWHETLHVSDSSFVHHQEFIHCTLSNGICHTAFDQDEDGTAVPSWSCSKAVYILVWRIPLLSVQRINWWWTEGLPETCRVSCQNKFVKLVHLVGFIIKKVTDVL